MPECIHVHSLGKREEHAYKDTQGDEVAWKGAPDGIDAHQCHVDYEEGDTANQRQYLLHITDIDQDIR